MATDTPGAELLPKAVLFDMDDTLFDHSLTCRAAIGRVRRGHPRLRTASLDALWEFYGDALRTTHAEVLRGTMTGAEARLRRWRALLAKFTGDGSRDEAEELSERYRREYLLRERAVPGALELLRRLHGRAVVAIVTNNEQLEQERKLRKIRADRWVDHLVVSEAVGAIKPDPKIFRIALRKARARSKEAVMVGDSWESDVLGAVGAGIRPVWFNRFHRPRPMAPAVAEVDSLRPARRMERLLAAPGPAASARIITRRPMQSR